MKKMICLTMALLMLVLLSASAVAEQVLSTAVGNQNVPFSNGYSGFCLDPKLHGAYPDDAFTPATDTSAATDNMATNADISQKLKVLFTQCFEDIFVSDGSGSYVLSDPNVIQGVTYHFTDNQYVWGTQLSLVNQVNAYSGPTIPDHGYQLTLSNGDVITFDFMVLIPEKATTQYFFAYLITTNHTEAEETVQIPIISVNDIGLRLAGATFALKDINGVTVGDPVTTNSDGEAVFSSVSSGSYTLIETVVPEGYLAVADSYAIKVEDGKVLLNQTDSNGIHIDDAGITISHVLNAGSVPPQEAPCTVTFDSAGGTSVAPQTVERGSMAEMPENPTRDGFIFEGWMLDGAEYDFSSPVTEDVTLVANWKEIPQAVIWTVTFDANGGDGTMSPQTFVDGETQKLNSNAFTRTGYTFEGWNTASDGSGSAFTDGENITAFFNATLYAQWKEAPVETLPEIIIQPEDAYVVEGQRAVFSVEATGDELSYQWYINRHDGNGWVKLDGAIGKEYVSSVTDLECDGFQYGCLITDKHGHILKSDVAVLNVSKAPVLPETGDSSTPALWLAISILSMLGILLLRRKAYRR